MIIFVLLILQIIKTTAQLTFVYNQTVYDNVPPAEYDYVIVDTSIRLHNVCRLVFTTTNVQGT